MGSFKLFAFSLAIVAASVIGAAASASAHSTSRSAHVTAREADTVDVDLLRRVNKFRRAHGRSKLAVDVRLDAAAEWMATDLGARNAAVLSHTDSRGRTPKRRLRAFKYRSSACLFKEDLAGGGEAAADVMRQWKASSLHRQNLLTRRMRGVGIARVNDPTSRYGWYWVIELGGCKVKKP